MLLHFFLYYILLIFSITQGTNSTTANNNITISLPSKKLYQVKAGVNITDINALSEGGPIVQTTQTIAPPKEIHPALLSLDTELGKDKSSAPLNSKVVPRKGVVFDDRSNATTLQHINETEKATNVTVLHDDLNESDNQTTIHKTSLLSFSTVSLNTTDTHVNNTLHEISSTESSTNKIQVVHKKPLVLSDEALANMPDVIKDEPIMPAVQSSKITLVADQMPSPRIQTATNRHPGMVMPIVITILVVPMFAVLGYMAVKRGREAWKNRHYKRMDFLLDGMYND